MLRLEEKLQDIFCGKVPEKYIFPLFWLKEDNPEAWQQEIAVMKKSGMAGFVVESRPYPDFPGEKWMRALELIISEAKRSNMQVYIFDDKHFPSGECAGLIEAGHGEFRRKLLRMEIVEVRGPQIGCSLNMQAFLRFPEDRFFRVTAFKVNAAGKAIANSQTDLTGRVAGNGTMYWKVPDGHWRICVFCTTVEGGEEHTRNYINMLDPAAVKFYLEKVYEPHYQRFAGEFGKTLKGFFSDEPRFGNAPSYHATLGKIPMVIPWDDALPELLAQAAGKDFTAELPLLFEDSTAQDSAAARQIYMDVVTRRYSEVFCMQIGEWCRAHKVEYIGHCVEDNGAHTRLGYGNGHFFRGQAGQDWAGVDTVLQQNVPGFTDGVYHNPYSEPYDCRFFHWGLGKLASSCAHLQANKQGRAFCEISGAYGWNAGLKMLKQLTDHFVVRGINRFLPHAFSPQTFPDADCPPHFYARGNNPQWRFFSYYGNYTNKLCHLFSGGVHIAPTAVLYHAEAEWSGGRYMPFEAVVQTLMSRQIDCDVVCYDMLKDAQVNVDKLIIAGEEFQFLIVPYAQTLPPELQTTLKKLSDKGLKIFSIACSYPGTRQVARLTALPELLRQNGLKNIFEITPAQPRLRTCHYRFDDGDVFMLLNENLHQKLRFKLQFNTRQKQFIKLDMLNDRSGKFRNNSMLELAPGESIILTNFTGNADCLPEAQYCGKLKKCLLELPPDKYAVSTAPAGPDLVFTPTDLHNIGNCNVPGRLPGFAGTIRYEQTIYFQQAIPEKLLLDAGAAGETVELWVNDKYAGCVIAPPYLFDISSLLKAGSNRIRLEVTTVLGTKMNQDIFTRALPGEAAGLIGPVRIGTPQQ